MDLKRIAVLVPHHHALAGQCDRIIELVNGAIVSDRRP
jgi:predicted ABC-type transport system involved in lysophospholipase L1 biosynthesis ATPase subunit